MNPIKKFISKMKRGTELVPRACTDLVVYEDTETEASLKAKLEKLKADIKYIREAMAKEQAFRDEMFDEMNPVLFDLIEKLEMLKAKHETYLYEARQQLLSGTFDPSLLDDEDFTGEGSDKEFIENGEEAPEEGNKANRATRKACGKLFKKISNLAHPDKNGGSDILAEIFHLAYEAYTNQDLEALEEIWEDLKGSKSGVKAIRSRSRQRLEAMIKEYQKVYDTVSNEMKGFMDCEDAVLTSIYRKSGLAAVTAAYRRMLVISIEEYEDAIENIKSGAKHTVRFDDIDQSFEESAFDDDRWDWEENNDIYPESRFDF